MPYDGIIQKARKIFVRSRLTLKCFRIKLVTRKVDKMWYLEAFRMILNLDQCECSYKKNVETTITISLIPEKFTGTAFYDIQDHFQTTVKLSRAK